MTESEAWSAIADTLEMTCEMPWWDGAENCAGLCSIIIKAEEDGFLRSALCNRMLNRIMGSLNHSFWLAPQRAVKPRIEWARRFAEESKR
jgi:hypothetical protein